MWRRGRSLVALAIGLVSVALVAPARATMMVELTLDELVRGCSCVAHGVVERVGTQMGVEGSAMPHTITRLRVTDWLAGEHGSDQVYIREPGAVWPTGGVRVDGVPAYRVGEEVIVFLRPDTNGFYRTFAMAQGKFTVARSQAGSLTHVKRDLQSMAFAQWSDGHMRVQPRAASQAAELGVFLDFIREIGRYRP